MTRSLLLMAAAGLALAACETTPPSTSTSGAVAIIQEAEAAPNPDYILAMNTVDGLVEAGNTPAAIDRLSQLIGKTDLSDKDRAKAIFKRGKLRYSDDGFNVWGAIEDFEEVTSDYPGFEQYDEALSLLGTARGEATSLNFNLETGELSRNDRFSARFRLGEYVDAIDYMESVNLTPKNNELLAMYNIGYLCDAEGLTGRTFEATDKDGDLLQLRFCDLGK